MSARGERQRAGRRQFDPALAASMSLPSSPSSVEGTRAKDNQIKHVASPSAPDFCSTAISPAQSQAKRRSGCCPAAGVEDRPAVPSLISARCILTLVDSCVAAARAPPADPDRAGVRARILRAASTRPPVGRWLPLAHRGRAERPYPASLLAPEGVSYSSTRPLLATLAIHLSAPRGGPAARFSLSPPRGSDLSPSACTARHFAFLLSRCAWRRRPDDRRGRRLRLHRRSQGCEANRCAAAAARPSPPRLSKRKGTIAARSRNCSRSPMATTHSNACMSLTDWSAACLTAGAAAASMSGRSSTPGHGA